MRRTMAALALTAAISATGIFPATPFPRDFSAAWAQPAPVPAAAPAEAKADVPVVGVTLYSSGVGYFQHAGSVNGNAMVVLPFKVGQINDVLKSLLLEDRGGQVGSVTYASEDPLAKTLKGFAVDIAGNPRLDQLLNQLRGATVTLTLATDQATGTILGVEQRTKAAENGKTFDVPVVNLFDGSSIRAIEMTDVRNIRVDDPELQTELAKALAAVAAARDQDKRPVAIHFQGQGQRDVLIGYVVETPVWKTSYRLVLADKGDAKLLGWAIVENQTDNDWNDVQLSLVSGRPISFVENLYQPVYIERPTVTPELYASLLPQLYGEGNPEISDGRGMDSKRSLGFNGPAAMAGQALADQLTTPPTAMGGMAFSTINPTESVVSAASAAQLGELFEYTIGGVSLARESSAMIPIVADAIGAERVSIYNPGVMPRNPLNGVRLKNTTGKHLLGGPITVLDDGAYAGDAQISNLPPDQERLISFGIDLQMLVDTTHPDDTDDILTGKIAKGVLYVTHKMVATTIYAAQNNSHHDKTLIIEHPMRQGWSLVDTPAPVETTNALYRFQETVAAGKGQSLTVKEQWVEDQEFAISDGDQDAIVEFSNTAALPQDVKDALTKAAALKGQMADAQAKIDGDRNRDSSIAEDQKRIDETLRTINQNTALYTRLLQKLDAQETELEKIRADEDAATAQLESLKQQLGDYLGSLNVG